MCRKCTEEIRPFEGLPCNESLEVVNELCYLVDMISAAGGVEEACVRSVVFHGSESWQ